MIELDSRVENRNTDERTASEYIPGIDALNVRPWRAARLAGVMEVPLQPEERVVWNLANVTDPVALGVRDFRKIIERFKVVILTIIITIRAHAHYARESVGFKDSQSKVFNRRTRSIVAPRGRSHEDFSRNISLVRGAECGLCGDQVKQARFGQMRHTVAFFQQSIVPSVFGLQGAKHSLVCDGVI
ncbi:MAG: hypothetical protein L0219_17930 [Phycisphaerales bacterium]|nr:hypothetical protein [Phycisphaerales bacterium]